MHIIILLLGVSWLWESETLNPKPYSGSGTDRGCVLWPSLQATAGPRPSSVVLGRQGTLRNPTSGSLKGDLIERVYIPKGP